MADTPANPEVSYSNAGESGAADCVQVDQGSGEAGRGRTIGFSSRARENCLRRSSKPDLIASMMSQWHGLNDPMIRPAGLQAAAGLTDPDEYYGQGPDNGLERPCSSVSISYKSWTPHIQKVCFTELISGSACCLQKKVIFCERLVTLV